MLKLQLQLRSEDKVQNYIYKGKILFEFLYIVYRIYIERIIFVKIKIRIKVTNILFICEVISKL